MRISSSLLPMTVAGLLAAVTSFGQTNTPGVTNGLFVTISAPDASASEAGDPGRFRVSRGTNTTGNLFVWLALTGTASNGVDYLTLSNRVLIPDGAATAEMAVTPIDDAAPEPTESVVARVILPSAGFVSYLVGSPASATVLITDNDGFVPSNQPPVVNIVQPLNNATFLAPAKISLWASAQDSDGFVTSVEFFANNQSLGFGMSSNSAGAINGGYFLTWSNVAAGAYDLTAKATDDDGAMRVSPPVHILVGTNPPPPSNQPPVVNIVQPSNNAAFLAPANISLWATAQDSDGFVTSVEFFANNQSLGFGVSSNSASPITGIYFLAWNNVAPGAYDLTAKATDDDGAMRVSPSVHILVGTNSPPPPSNQPPVVNIVQPLNNAAFLAPANLSLRATAQDSDGFVTSVEFFANNQSLGFGMSSNSAGAVNGGYFLTWSNVARGVYDLTAKATDDDGAMRVSPPVHIVVGTNPPTPPTNQLVLVNISATDPTASEGRVMWCSNTVLGVNWMWPTNGDANWFTNSPCPSGTNTATFTVRRSGSTNGSLRVYYSIGGSASNAVDYEALSGVVTIPAGARAARIVVTPIDDTLAEGVETVVLTLRLPLDPADTPYAIGLPANAAAYITDNDRPPPPCGVLAGGLVHLCWPFTNQCFRVERSTNLIHWAGFCTNGVADGAAHFLDPDATNCALQFIRVIPVPCPPEGQ